MDKRSRWVTGAGLLILFGLFQSLGSVAIRECLHDIPYVQLLGLQSGGALVLLSPWIFRKGWQGLSSNRVLEHILRGWIVLAALSSLVFSLSMLNVGDAVLLSNLAPIFVPFLAWIVLRQTPHFSVWLSAAVGFLGVYLVLNPSIAQMNLGWVIGIFGGLLMGISYLQVELLGTTEPPYRVVFYTLSTIFLTCLPMLLIGWQPMSLACGLFVGGAALALAGTSFTLIQGLMMGPASELSPFTYFSVLFAYFWGLLFYGKTLTPPQMLGIGLVVLAGTIALHWRTRHENL